MSTKNVDLTDTEVLASFYEESSTTNKKRSQSRRRSASGGHPTSSKASSKKLSIERVKPKGKAAAPATALNTRLISINEKKPKKVLASKR